MKGGHLWEVFLRELLSYIFLLSHCISGSKCEWMTPASVWGTLRSGNDIFPRRYPAASISLSVCLPRPIVWYERLRQTREGSEEYLLPGTHSHSRGMMRAGGENGLTFSCVFSWFVEIFTETGLQGEPQTREMSLGDTKMSKPRICLPGNPLAWDCCTPPCQARHCSPWCTDPPWSPAQSECSPGFFNEGKGGKVKPLEVEVEKFLLSLAAFSVFWDIRLPRKPGRADALSCFVFAQHLAVRMSSSFLGHLGIRQYKWDY